MHTSAPGTPRSDWWLPLKPFWQPVLDFVFPPVCLACHTSLSIPQAAFCASCRQALLNISGPQCVRCAAPVGPNTITVAGCGYCGTDHFAFRRVIALGVYETRLQMAIKQGQAVHGAPIMRALADLLLEERLNEFLMEAVHAVVAVPQDMRRRFFGVHSAAETLGQRLSDRLQRPFRRSVLQKPRATPSQTESAPHLRRKQQRGAFTVPVGFDLTGARVLLVDDVLTTGATAQAAAKALIAAGAEDVIVAVIARGLGASRLRR